MSSIFSITPNSLSFKTSGSQNARIYSDTDDVLTVEGATDSSRCIIAGVDTPTSDYHAATKKYVDDNGGGGGSVPDNSITNVKLFTGPTVTANKCDTSEVLVTTSTAQSKSGVLSITDTTQSTSSADGCVVLSGGLGIAKDMHCDGTLYATQYQTTSDKRLKENITPLHDPGRVLKQVQVYSYNFKTDPDHRLKYGVIAQEIENLPGLVDSVIGTKKIKTVDYTNFIALLIGTVNDLQERVEELENK